jgi:hypothetical protein
MHRAGEHACHRPGQLRLGRAPLGLVQPKQQREEHRPADQLHPAGDTEDHEAVAASDAVAAAGGPVMLPEGGEHALAVAVEQRVVDHHCNRLPGRIARRRSTCR